jgi:hypothetical protein
MSDPCCGLCRTPSGVCATRRTCEHHKAVRSEQERAVIVYKDPTGERAARNVDRERKKRKRKGG